jgi:hypothetical protein
VSAFVNRVRRESPARVRRRLRWSERLAGIVLVGLPVCGVTRAPTAVVVSVAVLGGLAGHLSFCTGEISERVAQLRRGVPADERSS